MIIAGIECEKCGAILYWPHVSKGRVMRWARRAGWSIGKQTLCPKCRNTKKPQIERTDINAS